MKAVTVLFLLSCVYSSLAFTGNINVNSVVTHLANFQGESGGFLYDGTENLRDTSSALFLASLFGSQSKIDTNRATQFVEKLNNPDNGYGNQVGATSDLESVKNALFSLANLKVPVTDPSAVGQFIHSLFDSNAKLFSNTKGATADLKATATAFECFTLLGLQDSKEVVEKQQAVKNSLTSLVRSEAGTKFFSSLTSDNYYGVVAAKHVKFGLEKDAAAWAKYFQSRQAPNGGFYSDAEHTEITVQDSSNSVIALATIEKSLANSINVPALVSYFNNLGGTPRTAALVYLALARTNAFQDSFKIDTAFPTRKHVSYANPDTFLQGSVFRPTLSLRSAFGLPQSAAEIDVTATHSTAQKQFKLTWDTEREIYQSFEPFETAGLFGDLTFSFKLHWPVPELGQVELTHTVTKPISFWTDVKARATSGGKTVETSGGPVEFGTQFSFDLTLGNVDNTPTKSLKQGDFDVFFTVLDSSNTVLHEQTVDARTNKDPFHFDYTLSATNVPAGQLSFRFSAKTGKVVHTTHVVPYSLHVSMVATDITFHNKKDKYQIGDTVEISMTPASQPDLRTAQQYGPGDRKFVLDVSGADSTSVHFSVDGVCKHSKFLSCTFKFPVKASFEALGEKHLSFHYKPAVGNNIPLKNFDTKLAELTDDVTYFVDAKLQVINDGQKPRNGQLEYGNNVKFTFQVEDQITKKTVWDETGSVFLALRHEKGKPTVFTSTLQPVHQIFDKAGKPVNFQADWTVNPNAVKGPSSLELVVRSHGKETPLLVGTQPWAVSIEIGGRIDVEKKTYSIVLEQDTVFFVNFQLSCQRAKLQNAALFAKVFDSKSQQVATGPVVLGPDGHYQISWALPTKKANTGEYTVRVYRDVDRRRHGDTVEPFFTTVLQHSTPLASPLPVRTEIVVCFILVACFFMASLKKMEIERIPIIKKK